MAGSWSGNNFYGDDTNDTAVGTEANNYMAGERGNDNLNGGGGNDVINGGHGNDDCLGGEGNDQLYDWDGEANPGELIGKDTLRGGLGDDVLTFYSPDTGDLCVGGGGTDLAVVMFTYGGTTTDFPVSFVLGNSSVVYLNSVPTVALDGVERIALYGSQGNDFLAGGDLNDTLDGDAGNDVLRGNGGDDYLMEAGGQLDIDGGTGFDVVYLDLSDTTTNIALDTTRSGRFDFGGMGVVKNCERISDLYTGSGNDRIEIKQESFLFLETGQGDDEIKLIGAAGSEIYDSYGNDTIRATQGSDEVDPGYGADLVYLGEGDDDLLYYWNTGNRTDTYSDTIYGEGGNDYIQTPAAADLIEGGVGNDTVYSGRSGDDIKGGDGDDLLVGEGGADRILGGEGNDVISADYDHYFDETPEEDDRLEGGAGADTLNAGRGLDTLDGGDGDDRLVINPFYEGDWDLTQVDVVRGGAGVDIFQVSTPWCINCDWEFDDTPLRVVLEAGRTRAKSNGVVFAEATGVERLDFSGRLPGDHYAVGGELADTLAAGDGDDELKGLGGDDVIHGDAGVDTLLAGLGNDTVSATIGGRDRVLLAEGDDQLTLNDYLRTGETATPGGRYDGGDGFDKLIVQFNSFNSTSTWDGRRIRFGDEVVGQTVGFEAFDYTGAGYNGVFRGSEGDDVIRMTKAGTAYGDKGDDTIWGSLYEAEVLDGGGGDDRLIGYSGNDTLNGGGGADRFFFAWSLNETTNVDTIEEFNVNADTIELGRFYFTGMAVGAVSDEAFIIGTEAQEWDDRLLYDADTGNLYFDSNGNYTGGRMLFAVLDPGLELTAANFVVV